MSQHKPLPVLSDTQLTELLESAVCQISTKRFEEHPGQLSLSTHLYPEVADLIGRSNIKHSVTLMVPASETLTGIIDDLGLIYGSFAPTIQDHYYLEMYGSSDGPRLSIKYQYILGSRSLGKLTEAHVDIIRQKLLVGLTPEGMKIPNHPAQEEITVMRNDKIAGIIPDLKAIVYTNEDCTELKLAGQVKDYPTIKKVFEDMGGKWHRQSGTHRFDESPMDRITDIIDTGEFKKTYNFGYFPTPPELVQEIIADLNYFDGMEVLEPSIGQAHIANVVKEQFPGIKIKGYEINPKNHAIASEKHDVELADFLAVEPEPIYDAVIMNPPFEKQQDIKHVEHAMKFLKPDGQLIAIMASGVTFRQDKRSQAFRDLVEANGGSIEMNPEGAFKSSGTQVNTVTVKLRAAPAPRKAPRM